MYVLKRLALSLAFGFTTVQQGLVFVGSWYFLGEPLPAVRVAGICVLMAGVLLLVPAIVTAEEKTESVPGAGGVGR
jgi:multidrug transporter EmrE-like cation transporter